ncbi:Protein of unknown function [Thermobacillus xylanilyticus]|uniref:Uncharacterized protein n=1 Tax=Thermobacillus xylanilyticus TaxID=76633 RepID=A0ABM8V718_THEXY|nr:Protein of unknown function [Thermobacillus xylanilyticus]
MRTLCNELAPNREYGHEKCSHKDSKAY